MKRLYSILIVALIILFVIFILQNAEDVDLTFLVWGVEMPKALLMMICAALGFLVGLLVFSFRKASPKEAPLKAAPAESSTSKDDDAKEASVHKPSSH
jgi:uncharacterized integral membrane protein